MKIRLQKVLAEAGLASRRASEALIIAGRVSVNGTVVRELGAKADPERDEVRCDGRRVRARRKLYLALNKPEGVVCSRKDPNGRRTVLDLLPPEWTQVYPVGRLDRETEGLLLLTNDGDFCLRVTHPRYGVRKRYVAVVEGRVEAPVVHKLTQGVLDQGERLRAERARCLQVNPTHSVVELELTEGKNREVRRLFEVQGLRVLRLKRVQVGTIKLGELRAGRWRVLQPAEVRSLMKASGGAAAPTDARARA